jgi:hypothetical protein
MKILINTPDNHNCPELDKLEKVVGIYDYLLQEGVVFEKKEIQKAKKLIEQLEKIIDEVIVRDL